MVHEHWCLQDLQPEVEKKLQPEWMLWAALQTHLCARALLLLGVSSHANLADPDHKPVLAQASVPSKEMQAQHQLLEMHF